jgi:hypothetical protein
MSIPKKSRPEQIDFSKDKLVFIQSDMDKSNFGICTDGKTVCMFDFADVGRLPDSFLGYTMAGPEDSFIGKVARHLRLSSIHNRSSMARASAILWASSDPTLGMSAISIRDF